MTSATHSRIRPNRIAVLLGRFHEVARCAQPKIKNGTIRTKAKEEM